MYTEDTSITFCEREENFCLLYRYTFSVGAVKKNILSCCCTVYATESRAGKFHAAGR